MLGAELAFQPCVDVRWPVGRPLTSYTIALDDVAIFASNPSRPFELVTFIRDRRVVHDWATGQMEGGRYVEVLGRRYWNLK